MRRRLHGSKKRKVRPVSKLRPLSGMQAHSKFVTHETRARLGEVELNEGTVARRRLSFQLMGVFACDRLAAGADLRSTESRAAKLSFKA
jgi:hypothetical protein